MIVPAEDRRGEARRRPELAEAHRRGLQRLDAAGADQQVGLQARGRQRDQVQPFHAAADQRAGRRHGTPALSRGTASRQPSVIGASASSRVRAIAACRDPMGGTAARQVGSRCMRMPTLETGQELENNSAVPTLKDKLAAGQFVITAEITPPVSCDAADLMAKALPLKGLADAVNVTDGAGARAHLAPVTAAAILLQNGIEPILQLTCRDRNRIALAERPDGGGGARHPQSAAAQGRRSRSRATSPTPSRCSTRHRGADRSRGRDARQGRAADRPQGRPARRDFFIGAADVPIDPPAGWEPKSLKGKIAAGCEFVQTQFCMDAGVVRRYMARLAEHGVQAAVPDRHFAAALGEVGALDEGEAVRHHHPGRDRSRGWRRRPIRPPRAGSSASI